MKNKKLLLTCILLLTISLFGCSSKTLDTSQITNIQLTPTQVIDDLTNISDIKNNQQALEPLIIIINQALKNNTVITDDTTNCSGDLQLTVTINNKTPRQFDLTFDSNHEVIYIKENDKLYSLDTQTAASFYQTDFYNKYLLINHKEPQLTIKANDHILNPMYTGNINYTHYNNKSLETEIPKITSTDPITISSQVDYLDLEFNIKPTKVIEYIYKENELLDRFFITDNQLSLPLLEGNYTIEIDCQWEEKNNVHLNGNLKYTLPIYYDFPAEFAISRNHGTPGEVFVVFAKNCNDNQIVEIDSSLYSNELTLFTEDNFKFGIIPIDAALAESEHQLIIKTKEPSTQEENQQLFNFKVANRDYTVQHLQIEESMLSLWADTDMERSRKMTKEARDINNSNTEFLYHDYFIMPCTGIITTEFYQIRYTNDNPTPRRHTGIDIARPYNTPIVAANDGVVVLTESFPASGNTLIIDHGCGLSSYCCHLNEFSVSLGDTVKKGDTVALMGSTGFSTGSHLHFEMYYNNMYLDPYYFFDGNPIKDAIEEYKRKAN